LAHLVVSPVFVLRWGPRRFGFGRTLAPCRSDSGIAVLRRWWLVLAEGSECGSLLDADAFGSLLGGLFCGESGTDPIGYFVKGNTRAPPFPDDLTRREAFPG